MLTPTRRFLWGESGPDAQKIVNVARECLKRGMALVIPGNRIGDIGFAIQSFADKGGVFGGQRVRGSRSRN